MAQEGMKKQDDPFLAQEGMKKWDDPFLAQEGMENKMIHSWAMKGWKTRWSIPGPGRDEKNNDPFMDGPIEVL